MRLRADKHAIEVRQEEAEARNAEWRKLSVQEKLASLAARDKARNEADAAFPYRYSSKRQTKLLTEAQNG